MGKGGCGEEEVAKRRGLEQCESRLESSFQNTDPAFTGRRESNSIVSLH